MVRLIGEALEYDIANTIIDDSEPERVAEEKESRRNRRKQKQQRRQTQENRDNTNDIVRNNPKIPPPGDTALGSFLFPRLYSYFHCQPTHNFLFSQAKLLRKNLITTVKLASNVIPI